MATWQITVRYGERYQRYHTFEVQGADVRSALQAAGAEVPDAVAEHADLVEVRIAVDPDERRYVGEGDSG